MSIALDRAPIDEVVFGAVWDRAEGPDSVDAGQYFAKRSERFARHELHEPIGNDPSSFFGPAPSRVWLVSSDDAWLVQLQPERFYANWRRRGASSYPGFSRDGGVMGFALDELAKLQAYCARAKAAPLIPVSLDLSKVDLLVQGKHWSDAADAAVLLPVLSGVQGCMREPGVNVSLQWKEQLSESESLVVSVTSARMKSLHGALVYRVDFKVSVALKEDEGRDIRRCLLRMNGILNDAFSRVIPISQHGRFA